MISENLRSKIKKLFDMAEMGTNNEAEVAFRKARELMAEHGITEDDIKHYVVEIPAPKRKAQWITTLFDLCGTFSGVVALYSRGKFIYGGDEIGVFIAKELFTYLKKEIERQLKKQNIKGAKLKNSFRVGCVIGIMRKMEAQGGWRDMEERRKNVQLVHYSKVEQYRRGKTIQVNQSAFVSGQASGADINISRQAGVNENIGLIGSN